MSPSGSADVFYPVHQLHPEPELPNRDHHHDLTLIFFHGFSNGTDAWEKTWIQRGDQRVCWPRNWLHKDEDQEGLGDNILVLSISFDGNPRGAHESVEEIGKNLLQSLVNNSKWKFHQGSQQIVLVGHSFGGLVIKSLMVEVDKAVKERALNAIEEKKQTRCKGFQENVKGIMFYAVPHTGTDKDFKTYLTACNNIPYLRNSKRLTGLMRSVDAFNRQMVDLSTTFEYSVPKDINLYAIVEGREVVVPEASARKLARNNFYKIEDANHMEVCQPVNESHESYQKFLQFVKDIRN
ncbi:unnamed protein product [Sphagnum jensenii]|uniref:DUF676 domain-containing protein n=1 Tax=Sphagnum jensenii TaxID=128206 RepID=A0ABP1A999_9BRYO